MAPSPTDPPERDPAPSSPVANLLQDHFAMLRAFIRLRMGEDLLARESCSDLAQSVCAEMLRRQNLDFDGPERFRAWMCKAALNKIRERRRFLQAQKRDAHREVPALSDAEIDLISHCYASVCTPSHHAMAREELARVEAAFEKLPDDYREVIALSRLMGLDSAQIASVMDRTPEAIRMLLHRALIRLSTVLERDHP